MSGHQQVSKVRQDIFAGLSLPYGELNVTDLRRYRESQKRRFSQIHPFSWKFKEADFRRKPKIFSETRRLGSVTC